MIRTDLAYEAHEMLSGNLAKKIKGITLDSIKYNHGEVIKMEIKDEQSEKKIGKKKGKYLTYETNSFKNIELETKREIIGIIAKCIKDLGDLENERVLVVGLGNRKITADALGPKVVEKIKITRHIFKAYNKSYDEDYSEVSTFIPGVMGTTGIETINSIKGIIDKINPTLLIVVDSLASRKMRRLCSVIQLTNSGIEPGSGIGNMQGSINKETTGIKVVAIGIPTVVDTATIVNDTIELMQDKIKENTKNSEKVFGILENLNKSEKHIFIKEVLSPLYNNTFVTPNEIDEIIENLSNIVSSAINIALHPGITLEDIKN